MYDRQHLKYRLEIAEIRLPEATDKAEREEILEEIRFVRNTLDFMTAMGA